MRENPATRMAASHTSAEAHPPPATEASKTATPAQLSAATILAVEDKLRLATAENELVHTVANELRKLIGGRQAVVFQAAAPEKFNVCCISSLATVDRETPFVRWLEALVQQITSEHGFSQSVAFELPAFADREAAETQSYPFRHMIWQPMPCPSGNSFAGLLLARERPWPDQDQKIIAREAQVSGRYWQALRGAKHFYPHRSFAARHRLAITVAAILICLCPVPMSTLAPVEIVAAQPQRVTSPLDGVIKEILIEPNQPVNTGQLVLRFEQTTLRNRHKIAEHEALVAKARLDRLTQAAHVDDKARHELSEAKAQFDLKTAEHDYAADLLDRSEIRAARDGILIYSEQERWIGRPVKTGERIMEIASPHETRARIELPVADAIVLDQSAKVRLFMDADPLSSVPASLTSESYQAEPNSTQQLVYRLSADFDRQHADLRIGARGTAQVQGGLVPLIFYLLRRPISSIRQYIGL